MKEIITNIDKLKEEEMTEIKRKVKLLLINSNKEIMLAYSNNEYQFPGGTNEENEKLIETVNREIEEETGIILNLEKLEPFACAKGYYKNWPEKGKNRKIEIYYYEIITDEQPKLDKLKLTEKEKNGDFELRFVSLDKVEEELINNVKIFGDPHSITKEMLELFKIYKNKDAENRKL